MSILFGLFVVLISWMRPPESMPLHPRFRRLPSHPQLLLADSYIREERFADAAHLLEDFIALHPRWPDAARVRQALAWLRRTS